MRALLLLSFVIGSLIFGFAPSAVEAASVQISAAKSAAYAEPSARSEVLWTFQRGASVEVLERRGDWLRVQVKAKGNFTFPAWIPARDVQSAAAAAPATDVQEKSVRGVITYVAADRLYIDKGLDDGVEVQRVVVLQRRGRDLGSCSIDFVGDHHATCSGAKASPGDEYRLTVTRSAKVKPAVVSQVPLSPAEIARRNGVVLRSEYRKVVFRGAGDEGRFWSYRIHPAVSHGGWYSSSDASFGQERLDVAAVHRSFGPKGMSASVDLSTLIWSQRPDDARFRPGDEFQFYLWEASVSYRDRKNPYTFAAGRVRPYNLPGFTIFDGAQAGYRFSEKSEIGAYGGLLPNLVTVYPSLDRITTGLYYTQEYVRTRENTLQQQFRLGFLMPDGSSSRTDFETLLTGIFHKKYTAGLDLRVKLAEGSSASFSLDAVRADFGAMITDAFRLSGAVRLLEDQISDPGEAVVPGRRGDLTATWMASHKLAISWISGVSDDLTAAQNRIYTGPEVQFRRLVNNRMDTRIGYQEEFGWLAGRIIYLQPNFAVTRNFKLSARGSYNHNDVEGLTSDEYGVFGGAEATLFSWLALRFGAQARFGDTPFGFVGNLGLSGQL